jgi:hypothetical protein
MAFSISVLDRVSFFMSDLQNLNQLEIRKKSFVVFIDIDDADINRRFKWKIKVLWSMCKQGKSPGPTGTL